MANTKYSDLLQYVLPDLVGCSAPLAEAHIRNSVIELCRRSKVWEYDVDPVTSTPGTAAYDVDVPAGTSLVEIKSLFYDGLLLDATSEVSDPALIGFPKTYRQSTPEQYALSPTPTDTSQITMTLALAPSRSSAAFPAWIAEKYHDGIVSGAKARLMMIPGHPWSNPQQGGYNRALFDAEVGNAASDSARSFARAPLRTTSQH